MLPDDDASRLQADLLVFVEAAKDGRPIVTVSVTETHHGLRLIREVIDERNSNDLAGEKGAQAVASVIYKWIDQAADKATQPNAEIFAVPPFVSDDLGFDFDNLKGAYARLVEETLQEQPGTLVADLDEARAISREIELSSGKDVQRPLPLYILGSYRNDGSGNQRRVRFTLKLMRGKMQISDVTKRDLAPIEVAGALRAATESFLTKGNVAARPLPDLRVEAAELAARACTMKLLGSWREEIELIDASLLLDPEQPGLHLDAVEVLSRFNEQKSPFSTATPVLQPAQGGAKIRIYRQGMGHLEIYLRQSNLDRKHVREFNVIFNFIGSIDHWGTDILRKRIVRGDVPLAIENVPRLTLDLLRTKYLKNEVGPYFDDYCAARREMIAMYYRVLADKARRKIVDDSLWPIQIFDRWYVALYLVHGLKQFDGTDPAVRREKRLKLLADFAYLPDEADYLERMIEFPGRVEADPRDEIHEPGYADFLNRAREIPNDGLRHKADELLAAIARTPRPTAPLPSHDADEIPKPRPKAPYRKSAPDDDVQLIPIDLSIDEDRGNRTPLPLEGWTPAGKGIDFIWNRHETFVMKRPGVLERIGGLPEKLSVSAVFAGKCSTRFDGRFVWMVYPTEQNRVRLLVIAPNERRVLSIDATSDLPACQEMSITPLEPGRIALIGYFGRTFAATVEINSLGKPVAKMLHEFRHSSGGNDPEQWQEVDTVFRPMALYTITASSAHEEDPHSSIAASKQDSSKRQIIAWRFGDNQLVLEHPILIDPTSGQVHLVEKRTFCYYPERMYVHDGVLDQFDAEKNRPVLHRFTADGVTTRDVGTQIMNITSVFAFGGAMHCIDNRWLIAGMDSGQFHPIKVTFPRADRDTVVYASEHYGLVAWARRWPIEAAEPDDSIYRVKFAHPIAELLQKH